MQTIATCTFALPPCHFQPLADLVEPRVLYQLRRVRGSQGGERIASSLGRLHDSRLLPGRDRGLLPPVAGSRRGERGMGEGERASREQRRKTRGARREEKRRVSRLLPAGLEQTLSSEGREPSGESEAGGPQLQAAVEHRRAARTC
eukprot:525948-Hanusia_phi.AAC.1